MAARFANETSRNPVWLCPGIRVDFFGDIMNRKPEATIMRRTWRQCRSRGNHILDNHFKFNDVKATAGNVVSIDSWEGTAWRAHARIHF